MAPDRNPIFRFQSYEQHERRPTINMHHAYTFYTVRILGRRAEASLYQRIQDTRWNPSN